MIRLGFVSNSSSSSFVIPKKYLTEENLEFYRQFAETSNNYDDELHETSMYIYGRVAYRNVILQKMFKSFVGKEGVDFYDD